MTSKNQPTSKDKGIVSERTRNSVTQSSVIRAL
jgi:hypothetical protein